MLPTCAHAKVTFDQRHRANTTYTSSRNHFSRYNEPHDFVGTFQYLMDAHVPHKPLNRVILEIPIASKHLERVVANSKACIRRISLGHGTSSGRVRMFFI